MHCRHSDNGVSMDRVKTLLSRSSCRCHLGRCFRKFAEGMGELMKFIIAFWGMEKPAQDAYVWSSEAVPRCQPHNIDLYMIKKKKFLPATWPYQPYLFTNWAEIYDRMKNTVWGNRSWQLCGKLVSSKCLASLLGIRPQRLKSAGMGRLDHRYKCFGAESRRTQDGAGVWVGVCVCVGACFFFCGHNVSEPKEKKRKPLKYMRIDQFFLRLYVHHGGMLPTQFPICKLSTRVLLQ